MHSEKLKNKIYINFLLIAAIFGIIYLFIYPQYTGTGSIYHPEKGISTLLQEKKDYQDAISLAETYNSKIRKANEDYGDALNKLPIDKLNSVLPSSIDPVYIVYELTKIAARPESGLILTSPKFTDDGVGNANTNKKYNTMTISFGVEGTYDNIKAFLTNLENSERIYNVTNLSFTSSSETRSTSAMKYSVTVETYYLKQK